MKKKSDYTHNENDYKDDCQNNWDGDRNSRSGPSLDDRHYRSVFLSARPSQLDLVPRRPLLPWVGDSGGQCYLPTAREY